jgi:hypothetical protein
MGILKNTLQIQPLHLWLNRLGFRAIRLKDRFFPVVIFLSTHNATDDHRISTPISGR